jgi:hypothetical protein
MICVKTDSAGHALLENDQTAGLSASKCLQHSKQPHMPQHIWRSLGYGWRRRQRRCGDRPALYHQRALRPVARELPTPVLPIVVAGVLFGWDAAVGTSLLASVLYFPPFFCFPARPAPVLPSSLSAIVAPRPPRSELILIIVVR